VRGTPVIFAGQSQKVPGETMSPGTIIMLLMLPMCGKTPLAVPKRYSVDKWQRAVIPR
jgi:hypothetical protein